MDREGAETYLRSLAEAAMRGSLTPAAAPRAPNASTIMAAGHALTAVGALDPVTAEEILTDFRLAVTVRQLRSEPGQAATAAHWLGRAGPSCAASRARPSHPGKGHPEKRQPEKGHPGRMPNRTEPIGSSRSG